MKYALIYTLALLSVFHTSCGQNQTNVPKDAINYNIKDTVTSYGPNTMVRNVKQDRSGNILFSASWGGVFRYDGKLFTKISSKIGSRRYWDVLEDRGGNLWFVSTDSGVYKFNGKTFRHFTTREGLASNLVLKIYEDRAGIIWFAVVGGLTRYDGKSFQKFTTQDGLPHPGVKDIMEDKTGKLWIGTEGGLCFYDGKIFTIIKNKDGKDFKNIWSVIEDKKGNIWFGDVDGLWRYDGRTFTHVSQRGAYAIIEDKKGNIWTTGEVRFQVWALCRYDQKSLYDVNPAVTEIMSTGKFFCGILEAGDGSIWFGSFYGVYRYDGKTITDFRTKEIQESGPNL
jgi:ligand-binding sensor domain-containing protein